MSQNLPKIIYGTAWKKERTKELVITAVLQGFRAIDTACQPKHYREDLVGEALQEIYDKYGLKREDIWLQTKFTSIDGQDLSKPLPYDPNTPPATQLQASVKTSLRQLHTTYLDSLVLHSPLRTLADTLAVWSVLGQLQDEGIVKSIGVSNVYDVGILEAMGQVRPVQVVQDRWYERNGWDKDVVSYCRKNGIMYQSFWTLTGSPSLLKHHAISKIAQSLGCTPAQVVFLIAQANGVTPLSGSKDKEHMGHGLNTEKLSLDKFASDEDLQELLKLLFA